MMWFPLCVNGFVCFLLFVFVICDNSVDRVLHGLLLFHGELSAKRAMQNALVLVQISKKNVHCTL